MDPLKPIAGAIAVSIVSLVLAIQPTLAQTAPAPSTTQPRPHHVYLIGSLRVSQPWIDIDGAADDRASGYVVVENHGDAPERITGASLDDATSVSLAGSSDDAAGTAGLVVPPNSTLTLKPGAAHFVLHGLHGNVQKGAMVNGTIRFERSGPLRLSFTTDPADAAGDDQTSRLARKPVTLEEEE